MYINIKYLNEIKRLQKLAGISEIKVTRSGKMYYIQDWIKPYIGKSYDDIKDELGEDTADVLYLVNEIQKDSNNEYITDQEINEWIREDEMWSDTDKDTLLQYLRSYNIIELNQ